MKFEEWWDEHKDWFRQCSRKFCCKELWTQKEAALAEKERELNISRALEAKFFPQTAAYKIVSEMEKAGLGTGAHGNTLLGMAENALEQLAEKEAELETLKLGNDILERELASNKKALAELREKARRLLDIFGEGIQYPVFYDFENVFSAVAELRAAIEKPEAGKGE